MYVHPLKTQVIASLPQQRDCREYSKNKTKQRLKLHFICSVFHRQFFYHLTENSAVISSGQVTADQEPPDEDDDPREDDQS